ncbi:unnamed protein product [Microthlaspi erraticum]|uniref:Glabrous enhancer-binding protein-like C-terminal domain-containing protein n=1 Tax=Microthlaspi erraticum TaxID=1685480 RepID=A0A6D2HVC7_9BRAS|nr:unnamed protein product [Microthlaspi erraticum]
MLSFDSTEAKNQHTSSALVAATMQGSYSETATESESESQHSTVTTAASALPKRKCKRLSEEATTTSKKVKRANVETDLIMNSFVVGHLVRLGVSEERVKEGWSLVPVERKKRIEEEYKALMREEMQRVARKAYLVRYLFN